MRKRRQEWVERVDRWRRSGMTAKQFAASMGVNAGTLAHWSWRLGREQRTLKTRPAASQRALVEIVTGATGDDRFELVVGNGRRVHVPASFDAAALVRLLTVLEAGR